MSLTRILDWQVFGLGPSLWRSLRRPWTQSILVIGSNPDGCSTPQFPLMKGNDSLHEILHFRYRSLPQNKPGNASVGDSAVGKPSPSKIGKACCESMKPQYMRTVVLLNLDAWSVVTVQHFDIVVMPAQKKTVVHAQHSHNTHTHTHTCMRPCTPAHTHNIHAHMYVYVLHIANRW